MAGPDAAIELKGASYPLPSLRLLSTDLRAVEVALRAKIAQAPGMLLQAPLVIDLSAVGQDGTGLEISPLVALIRSHGLIPVGVCNGSKQHERHALEAGLGILQKRNGNAAHDSVRRKETAPAAGGEPDPVPPSDAARPLDGPVPAAPTAAATRAESPPTRLIQQAVRSGQKIYARQCDLVVIGAINAGAEVIADGHIHIYGPLRGRALAGASGNEQARIFCHSLEAELVAIAGIYRVFEQAEDQLRERRVQIYLNGDRLEATPL